MLQYRLGSAQSVRNGGFDVAISKDARKCVVFFGLPAPPKGGVASTASSEVDYAGTGFLASYDEEGERYGYLVTCRHVARHLEDGFFIRANTVTGGVEPLEVGTDADWQYHPDKNVDVAVAAIRLNARYYDHLMVPLRMISHPGDIAAGQRMHIVGLFRLHYGKKRNIPIVHTGHIAALPDFDEKMGMSRLMLK
jgi:hypothetical protein